MGTEKILSHPRESALIHGATVVHKLARARNGARMATDHGTPSHRSYHGRQCAAKMKEEPQVEVHLSRLRHILGESSDQPAACIV